MKIQSEHLRDLITCPLRAKFIMLRLPVSSKIADNTYRIVIAKLISEFSNRLIPGSPIKVDIGEMRKRWTHLWYTEYGMGNILDPKEQREYDLRASKAINNYMNFIDTTTRAIIDADFPVGIEIGDTEWEDIIPLIRESKPGPGKRRGPIELVNWSYGQQLPSLIETELSISLALQSHIFGVVFAQKEDCTVLYNLETGKSHVLLFSEIDHNRAIEALKNISLAVEHPYPRPSYLCKSCPYQDWCKQYGDSRLSNMIKGGINTEHR